MYNTRFKRFLAAFFDGIFLTLISKIQHLLPLDNKIITISWIIFFALFGYAYSIFCHYRFGQTIGKFFMNVKVFDISETKKLTLKQAILRDSIGLIVLIYSSIRILVDLHFNQIDFEIAQATFYSNANDILAIWTLVELITMFFNKKRRALHDYLAKTVVKEYYK